MKEILFAVSMLGIAACAVFVLVLLPRAPAVVAGVILIHGGVSSIFDPGAILTLGSITVYLPDIIYGLVAGAAFIRILGLFRLSLPQVALVAIAGLALFSVARGAGEDTATAINEFRLVFYFLCAALYFVTVEPTKEFLERVTHLIYAAALLILGTSLVFWAAFLTGASLPDFIAPPYEGGFRAVHAASALILAQACLIALPAWRLRQDSKRVFERYLVFILIPAVLLLQWRVVWILFLVGLAVAGSRDLALGRKVLVPVIGTVVVGFLVLSMVFVGGDSPSLEKSLGTTATTADSLFWRIEGWRELTAKGPESTSEVFLGAPYGRGWERVIGEEEVTAPPHSFYLDNYLRHGLIALVFLVLLYWWAIRHLKAAAGDRSGPGLVNPNMLLVLLTSQLIFFITFSPSPEQGLIAGIAFSAALKARSTDGSTTQKPATEPDRKPAMAR